MNVSLLPITEPSAYQLWEEGHTEPDWPRDLYSWDAFKSHFARFLALDELGLGSLRIVYAGENVAGFVTMIAADERFLPDGIHGIECGTYLLESFRHTGVNAAVKQECFKLAYRDEEVDCCIFVVAKHNLRAARALQKLGLQSLSNDAPTSNTHDLRAFLKRKAWEHGEDCIVFASWRHCHKDDGGLASEDFNEARD